MIKMRYGLQGQVSFHDLNEYYFALGFLANTRNAELRWENNEDQGAWGSEGRIHCIVPESKFPQFFKFTAGRGSVYARINCNEYVSTLVTEHNFNYNSRGQNVSKILETVPDQYVQVFEDGYSGNIGANPTYEMPTQKNPVKISSTMQKTATTYTIPAKIEEPNLSPLPVTVGEKIIHSKFGVGTIYLIESNYIRINFDKFGNKLFLNPDAFTSGFLNKL